MSLSAVIKAKADSSDIVKSSSCSETLLIKTAFIFGLTSAFWTVQNPK
jgi:hypothetical protein